MRKKFKEHRRTMLLALYTVFTIMCSCLSWIFSEYRVLLFQLWYRVTAAIWLVLAIMALTLLIKLLKIKKLRDEINHRRG